MSPLRQSFDAQLSALQQELCRMGSYVEDMLDYAMKALATQDADLANRAIAMDDTADSMDISIETMCMRLLALQQPMAKDLRIISTALKIITDLERIGDFAVDIAKTARRMAHEPYFKRLEDIPRMGTIVTRMVRLCLDAYVRRDLETVYTVVRMDDEVDNYEDRLFQEILSAMQQDPKFIVQATQLLFVTRFLERIADHTVNIAERVYYMETGELKQLAASHKGGTL
jgi:phosphate transport system protein